MSRREFSKPTQREALARADGYCEGILASGRRCGGVLTIGKYHFDHVIPAALGGGPELFNCAVLCLVCHAEKTTKKDVPVIAKAKRVSDQHLGIGLRKGPKIQSRGFTKRPPQRTASRPIEKRP